MMGCGVNNWYVIVLSAVRCRQGECSHLLEVETKGGNYHYLTLCSFQLMEPGEGGMWGGRANLRQWS
jgi:hypothetical protein